MDRFTEKDHDGFYLVGDLIYGDDGDPEKFRGYAIDKLAHYEYLEEQGRLVELPCNVGDSFFRIERFCDEHGELEEPEMHWCSDCEYCCKPCNAELRVVEYSFSNIRHIIDMESAIGKSVFLYRPEAESALAAIERRRGEE